MSSEFEFKSRFNHVHDPTKPTIYIKTKAQPFDDGTCRTCWCNHSYQSDSKTTSLASLFWPEKEDD